MFCNNNCQCLLTQIVEVYTSILRFTRIIHFSRTGVWYHNNDTENITVLKISFTSFKMT